MSTSLEDGNKVIKTKATSDITTIYLKEIGKTKLLTTKEEKYYGELAKNGDQEARRIMIESNLRLVVKISRWYLNKGLPILDLIEEGNLGLIQAVKKFDPDLGFKFSTYATWWIKESIRRATMDTTRTIRLPIHIGEEVNKYVKAKNKLLQQSGNNPRVEDIATYVDRPVERVRKILKFSEVTSSLDVPSIKDSERHVIDSISKEGDISPADQAHNDVCKKNITNLIDKLQGRQKRIICLRYGLNGCRTHTLEEVGYALNITRERTRQIQRDSLVRLRKLSEQAKYSLEDFF